MPPRLKLETIVTAKYDPRLGETELSFRVGRLILGACRSKAVASLATHYSYTRESVSLLYSAIFGRSEQP